MSTNNNRLGKEVKPLWKGKAEEERKVARLSSSKLQSLMTNSLEDLTALTLSYRAIERIDSLTGLRALRRLDMSYNFLTRLSGFEELSSLSLLNVSNNDLAGDGLEELRYLPELRTLNIGNNPRIRGLQSHTVKPITKLAALIANDCGLEKASFVRLLPMLNTLILSKNKLTRFPPDVSLTGLTKLNLGNNQFSGIPDLSTCCPNLTELKMSHNSISKVPPHVVKNQKLKILDLSFNQISDWKCIELLTELRNLTHFSLKGNPLPAPPAEVDKLFLREDVGADKMVEEKERRYRHYALHLFQKLVGKEKKPKVQLIVFDNIRVKSKWSHKSADQKAVSSSNEHHDGHSSEEVIQTKKRNLDPQPEFVVHPEIESVAATEEVEVENQPHTSKKIKGPELPIANFTPVTALDSGVVKVRGVKTKKSKGKKSSSDEDVLLKVLNAPRLDSLNVGLGGASSWDE